MARPNYSKSQIQEIEARIYAAALNVFAAEGYRNFSLRAVARELGLTPPALYRYVDNKDRLLAEIRAEGFRQLGSIFEQVKARKIKPITKVRALLRAYLNFAMNEPELYRAMYELDQDEAPLPKWAHEIRQEAFNVAATIANEFVADGKYQVQALELVHLWWSGVHGLAGLELANQLNMGCDRQKLIEPLIAMMTNANYIKSI